MEDPNAETLGWASKQISEVRLLLLTCDSHYHHSPLSSKKYIVLVNNKYIEVRVIVSKK